ncbi:Trp biosynthesis-associated membrane protein [Nakamurella flavida]|uniref:Trp biosynthesis-associated membrane protein n=1 Tax=Nakamurella flavida TaxID=363630 RepID=A0A938YM55_9ACTN|nr:Trp biosynthesis-associated membrane protein [Nakamurella flavida]MBM9475450.1 Trp biosynthesis-associated membrane protein [Nakamurella flavida]MDP9777043.1 putative membrane protein (TIGR02234 family) [Nakamurella flavida]
MAEASTARRPLAVIALAAVLGAIAMAAAAGFTWWSQPFDDSLTGRIDATASGAATLPELVPVALVVLAGLGATLATRGVARRLVGGLLVLAGLLVGVRAVLALFTPPAALAGQLVRPATATAEATGRPWGPLIAVVGALAVVVAGLLVVTGRGVGRRRTLGARYERRRPGSRTPGASTASMLPVPDPGRQDGVTSTAGSGPVGPDDGSGAGGAGDAEARTVDWWNQLDSGSDPTAGADGRQVVTRRDGPGGGATDPSDPPEPPTERGPG